MSTTHLDAESTNTLFDLIGDYAPEALSREEHDRILADIRSLRAVIANFDTAICCEQGSFRQWCYLQRANMRAELAMLWRQLGEVA